MSNPDTTGGVGGDRPMDPPASASVVVNEVREGLYLDSVALMRMSRAIAALPGVEDCGMMMATPANTRIMADAGVLAGNGAAAGPGDLVIAIRGADAASVDAALAAARAALDKPKGGGTAGGASTWAPRSIRAAVAQMPDATLALISVPGAFAAAEARKALARGLNVMMFSDNVALADEVALKREARALGLLMMGPDCGTAIIAGAPLGFANVVPSGGIGIVGASGTGIQEVACLIANNGGGISHAIGTGGRDLKAEVGGVTTLMAIDLLDADPATRHIVVISKPPAAAVATAVLARVAQSPKPFTICFIGGTDQALPVNALMASTLEAAAYLALGRRPPAGTPAVRSGTLQTGALPQDALRAGCIRGLFAGGTLCAEAQVILRDAGLTVASNVPVAGVAAAAGNTCGHCLLDLGDDDYTLGRPHPMIEPAVRDAPLAAALVDPAVAVVLLDCVLGFGGHGDPAGHLASVLSGRPGGGPAIIASVTGTDGDPQRRTVQVATLERAGVVVAGSGAAAARLAVALASGGCR